ncbi:hypothetical protein [Evansella cellulosilytica]|uniref:Uncharacterized protein n=1 Tax=Evansella cellulosilytica (strain ATCC 21833 / DSM 2522 / FERM P-1141 / JCM 9156 / N-4) TaxID=649639 RepID=E6TVL8_EVAC2|nr:hypothetical protein [Evansella cellulosilytica]ADU32146.1 hypothetical protein Bcell_3910 [Evansella cellulosilytica DSM 2522]
MKNILLAIITVLVLGAGIWIGILQSQNNSLEKVEAEVSIEEIIENPEFKGFVTYPNEMLAQNLDLLINLVYHDMNDLNGRLDETIETNELSGMNALILYRNAFDFRNMFIDLNNIGMSLAAAAREDHDWSAKRDVFDDFYDLLEPYQESTATQYPLNDSEMEQIKEIKRILVEWKNIMENYIDIPTEELYDARNPEWRQLMNELNEVVK